MIKYYFIYKSSKSIENVKCTSTVYHTRRWKILKKSATKKARRRNNIDSNQSKSAGISNEMPSTKCALFTFFTVLTTTDDIQYIFSYIQLNPQERERKKRRNGNGRVFVHYSNHFPRQSTAPHHPPYR